MVNGDPVTCYRERVRFTVAKSPFSILHSPFNILPPGAIMAVNLRALRIRGLASSGPYPLPAQPTQPTGSAPAIQSDPALQAGPAQLADAITSGLGGLMQPPAAESSGSIAPPQITAGAGTPSQLPSPTAPGPPSTPGTPGAPTTPKAPTPPTTNPDQARWDADYAAARALPSPQRYAFWLTKSTWRSNPRYAAAYQHLLNVTKGFATNNTKTKTPITQTRSF